MCLHQDKPSAAFLIARAERFLHDLAAGEIEELADYLAEAGFSDTSRACVAIRSSLVRLIEDLQADTEIEQAIVVKSLLARIDAIWERW